MNSNRSNYDSQIDAALSLLAHAEPRPGLEARVAAHLASHGAVDDRARRFRFVQQFAIGALGVATACGIVIGSVVHSRNSIAFPPAIHGQPTGGVGSAGAIHTPTQVIHPSIQLQPRSLTRPPHSRATVAPDHVHRSSGTAVPRSPYPPAHQPEAQPDAQK